MREEQTEYEVGAGKALVLEAGRRMSGTEPARSIRRFIGAFHPWASGRAHPAGGYSLDKPAIQRHGRRR